MYTEVMTSFILQSEMRITAFYDHFFISHSTPTTVLKHLQTKCTISDISHFFSTKWWKKRHDVI